VIREEHFLQWKPVESAAGQDVEYRIQESTDPLFRGKAQAEYKTRDTIFPLTAGENKRKYWRIRPETRRGGGLSLTHRGPWSEPIAMDHYTSALERIIEKQQVVVAVDEAFGRTPFRWLKSVKVQKPNDKHVEATTVFEGVEPDIVSRIADAICHTIEPKDEYECIDKNGPPSKQKDCTNKKCRDAGAGNKTSYPFHHSELS
jgi:hypothetical protein